MPTITKIQNRPLSQVAEFHEAFNMPILKPTETPTKERITLRIRLLREETKELYEALLDKDIHHAAKELADLYYVYWGAVLEFGLYRAVNASPNIPSKKTPNTVSAALANLFLRFISNQIDQLEGSKTEHALSIMNGIRLEIDNICQLMGMGSQMQDVFDEVHRSNMSKVFPDGTVKYREDGKVLKPDTYSKADIKSVLKV